MPKLSSIIAAAASLIARATRADILYVSPTGTNAGAGTSEAGAWRTLQYAADRARPGDTVTVLSGNYAGFDIRHGGTAASPITFLARPGATINQTIPGGRLDGINIENASYVTVDGFTLSGTGTNATSEAGIRVVGDGFDNANAFTRGVVLRNNKCDRWGVWGIFTAFTDDVLIENNECSRSYQQHGIYFSNSADRPTIRGNRVWGNAAAGIHMNGDVFTGDTSLPGVDGIITGAVVERNVIYGNGVGSAITPGGGAAINGDGLQSSVIRNNLLYDNHASGITLFRQDGGGPSSGNVVANNTAINASNGRYVLLMNNGAVGNTLMNNVFFNLNPNAVRGSISVTTDSTAGLKSDYNFLDPRFEIDDVGGKTFAQWRAATGNGDAHSLTITAAQMQALFRDYAANDYTLAASSAARDAGTKGLINGTFKPPPADDLAGLPRPMGVAHDVGAYEYRVLAADANYDGRVDRADFAIALSNYGATGDFRMGDFSGDGRISFVDLQIFELAFGEVLPADPAWGSAAASAGVPEPSAALGLGTAAVGALARRRRGDAPAAT
jgi:parallel beta-helix repeat protein